MDTRKMLLIICNEFYRHELILLQTYVRSENLVNMSQSEYMDSSIPDDIALKSVSSLQVWDVCSLGSCSKFWQKLCRSDCVWSSLFRDRWPHLLLDYKQSSETCFKGWRSLYITKHNEMASNAAMVVEFLEKCLRSESIEVGQYLKAIKDLYSMRFGYKDVQMFFLKPETNVLLNLVGLHYCISWLRLPWDQYNFKSAMGPASVELLATGLDGYTDQAKWVSGLMSYLGRYGLLQMYRHSTDDN